jgi:hypothetical protein
MFLGLLISPSVSGAGRVGEPSSLSSRAPLLPNGAKKEAAAYGPAATISPRFRPSCPFFAFFLCVLVHTAGLFYKDAKQEVMKDARVSHREKPLPVPICCSGHACKMQAPTLLCSARRGDTA